MVAAVLSDGFRNEIFVDRTSLVERVSLEGIGDGVVGVAYVQLRLATAFAKSNARPLVWIPILSSSLLPRNHRQPILYAPAE